MQARKIENTRSMNAEEVWIKATFCATSYQARSFSLSSQKPTNRSQNSSETLRCCFRQTAHILIVRKLISRIIEHQKTRTQNSSRRCANTNRYKYLKHKAPGMPLSTGYMIKIKQCMLVSDMYMLIDLKYARAYALFTKAFCYAQKGQICLKICGPYGPKPIVLAIQILLTCPLKNYVILVLKQSTGTALSQCPLKTILVSSRTNVLYEYLLFVQTQTKSLSQINTNWYNFQAAKTINSSYTDLPFSCTVQPF